MTIAWVKATPGRPITSAATGGSRGEARAVDVVELLRRYAFSWSANSLWIERWRSSRNSVAELLGVAARGEEAVAPGVRVAERLRDALEADRERAKHGRAGRLDTAQRTGRRPSGTRAR